MIDELVQKYSDTISQIGIEHSILEHAYSANPVEVQSFFNLTIADSCPTLVMKADGGFVAIVKKGDTKLDFKKVKKLLHISNLRMASKEEYEEITHLPVGAARVYIPELKTLLDQKLFDKEYLNGGTGSFTSTFKYKDADFKKIPNSMVVDITE